MNPTIPQDRKRFYFLLIIMTCVSLIVGKKVFTGDTLFAGGIGRTDLPGGSSIEIMHSIREKLMPLEVSSEILPGHGPSSILQQEIENNPWLQS